METTAKKIIKKLDESYKNILKFLETGKVSLFHKKNYHVSVFFGQD